MNLENKKQVMIVLLAIGLGLVAAILTGNHIQNSIKEETARLSAEYENKKIRPLVKEIESLREEMKKLANQQAVVARQGGAPIKEESSLPKSSLALRTPAGKRAYTILIDSLSAVGGLVNPGDFVDFIAQVDIPDPATNKSDKVTSIIFQNVQILAVGTNLQAPGGYEKQQQAHALAITLALSPEETGLMSFVQTHGKLQMVLRAPSETKTESLQASDWGALADYVYQKQGTELSIPRSRAMIEPVPTTTKEEVKPFIQIYQGGREQQ